VLGVNGPSPQQTRSSDASTRRARPQLRLIGGATRGTVRAQSAASLSATLQRYELGAIIGRGTFGVVYEARHRALGRSVAIKRLWPDLVADAGARRRFAVEARLMASLDHPHIVRVYDYLDDEVCALVLEHMPSGTLHDRLTKGRVAPSTACGIALDALSALEHAHQRGFVHLDVKPQNLLFSSTGAIKLVDFGLATAIRAGSPARATPAMDGTPAFMAPEQIDGALGRISPATDVWALGAVLYQMLGGPWPLPPGDDITDLLLERVRGVVPPLRTTGVKPALSDVVAKALARLPADRFQSAAQFADALGRSRTARRRLTSRRGRSRRAWCADPT
jgi:serine/threonine-protein kinase